MTGCKPANVILGVNEGDEANGVMHTRSRLRKQSTNTDMVEGNRLGNMIGTRQTLQ